MDVCNRRCQHPGCSKRPCFGLPGHRPCFCGTHRTSRMVDVISHKCGYPGCSHPTGYEANRVRSKFCGELFVRRVVPFVPCVRVEVQGRFRVCRLQEGTPK